MFRNALASVIVSSCFPSSSGSFTFVLILPMYWASALAISSFSCLTACLYALLLHPLEQYWVLVVLAMNLLLQNLQTLSICILLLIAFGCFYAHLPTIFWRFATLNEGCQKEKLISYFFAAPVNFSFKRRPKAVSAFLYGSIILLGFSIKSILDNLKMNGF